MRVDNPKISAVIITDDNLECINAIKSVYDSCSEIIVVNTVKTRKVNEAVREYSKVRMFYFKWCEHYSKARNYGIRKAKGDWILTIDSDEVLKQKIEYLDDDYLAYMTKQVSQGKGYWTARLFQNNKGIFYKNRIHELIDHKITPTNSVHSDIVIEHSGYDITPEQMQEKIKRNYELMFKDKKNVLYNMHMGNYYMDTGEYIQAILHFNKAMTDRLNDPHFAVIQNKIHTCRLLLGQSVETLLMTLRRSLMFEPFQFYARANIVLHLLSTINDKNKQTHIIEIEKELEKIQSIYDSKLSNLLFSEIGMSQEWINEKYEELNKWKEQRPKVLPESEMQMSQMWQM